MSLTPTQQFMESFFMDMHLPEGEQYHFSFATIVLRLTESGMDAKDAVEIVAAFFEDSDNEDWAPGLPVVAPGMAVSVIPEELSFENED